jgi:hypothetical protein
MIRVTVELISAIDGHREILGMATIFNDAKGSSVSGNYEYAFSKRGKHENITWKSGNIKGFPRKRLLAWDLLYRCLKDAVSERNN